jgi:hypothetical protein
MTINLTNNHCVPLILQSLRLGYWPFYTSNGLRFPQVLSCMLIWRLSPTIKSASIVDLVVNVAQCNWIASLNLLPHSICDSVTIKHSCSDMAYQTKTEPSVQKCLKWCCRSPRPDRDRLLACLHAHITMSRSPVWLVIETTVRDFGCTAWSSQR